jgi:hypothetical protein
MKADARAATILESYSFLVDATKFGIVVTPVQKEVNISI